MRSGSKVFAISLVALLLCVACGSSQGFTGDALVPLAGIKTANDAQRALIIAQEVRYSTMKVVKQTDRTDDDDKFRTVDSKFRPAWDASDSLVTKWKLLGERPLTFNDLYKIILETGLDMLSLKEAP